MSVYRKFDPATVLANYSPTPAKVAKAANLCPEISKLAKLAEHPRANLDLERVAIIAEANAPLDWIEAYAALQSLPCPDHHTPDRWRAIVNAGGVFLDKWAHQAAALGWDAREFYGVSGPDYQYGALVETLADAPVAAVTALGLTVRFPDGGIRVIRKQHDGWYWQ